MLTSSGNFRFSVLAVSAVMILTASVVSAQGGATSYEFPGAYYYSAVANLQLKDYELGVQRGIRYGESIRH